MTETWLWGNSNSSSILALPWVVTCILSSKTLANKCRGQVKTSKKASSSTIGIRTNTTPNSNKCRCRCREHPWICTPRTALTVAWITPTGIIYPLWEAASESWITSLTISTWTLSMEGAISTPCSRVWTRLIMTVIKPCIRVCPMECLMAFTRITISNDRQAIPDLVMPICGRKSSLVDPLIRASTQAIWPPIKECENTLREMWKRPGVV